VSEDVIEDLPSLMATISSKWLLLIQLEGEEERRLETARRDASEKALKAKDLKRRDAEN
jgi:hypothetical protein